MKLLVVRHAIAEERESWARTGRPDEERPLTADGRARMRRAAQGLRAEVGEIDVLAMSPLVRARQTAEILSRAYDGIDAVEIAALAPEGDADDLLAWLRTQDDDATVAIVGHEPHLGLRVGWLLTGRHDAFLELKKGGALLLTFDDSPAPGGATLVWALAPRHLRRLRD